MTDSSALGQWRIVTRIDRVREILLFGPGPELTDVVICLDGLVPELQPELGSFLIDAANVDIADDIVEVIELDRPSGRVGQIHALEASVDDLAIDVEPGRVEARNSIVVLDHAVDKSVVGIRLEIKGVGTARNETDSLIAEALEQRVISSGLASDHRIFQAGARVCLHEPQGVRPGKTLTDPVAVADLRNIGRVVRSDDRRP